MNVNSMEELRKAMLHEAEKAMRVASEKILAEMHHETGDFYTGGEPEIYERTGALGDTPKTTAITQSGDSVSFDAYLDQSHTYTTGKNPTMHDVLILTNNGSFPGLHPAVGKTGFWDRAEDKMQDILDDVMGKTFH